MKVLIIILSLSSFLFSQTQDSMIMVKKSDLPIELVNKYETIKQVEKIGSWVGLGKEVGTAMKEGLSALNTEVAAFSDSKAGKFTMFIIAYKILGKDLLKMVVISGVIFFFLLLGAFYYIFIFPKIKDKIIEASYDKTTTIFCLTVVPLIFLFMFVGILLLGMFG